MRLRPGDRVIVASGEHRGRSGDIVQVDREGPSTGAARVDLGKDGIVEFKAEDLVSVPPSVTRPTEPQPEPANLVDLPDNFAQIIEDALAKIPHGKIQNVTQNVYVPPSQITQGESRILKHFSFGHLGHLALQETSRLFYELAHRMEDILPAGPEKSVAMRKLLEAKDAAVRSVVEDLPDTPAQPMVEVGGQVMTQAQWDAAVKAVRGTSSMAEPVTRELNPLPSAPYMLRTVEDARLLVENASIFVAFVDGSPAIIWTNEDAAWFGVRGITEEDVDLSEESKKTLGVAVYFDHDEPFEEHLPLQVLWHNANSDSWPTL